LPGTGRGASAIRPEVDACDRGIVEVLQLIRAGGILRQECPPLLGADAFHEELDRAGLQVVEGIPGRDRLEGRCRGVGRFAPVLPYRIL